MLETSRNAGSLKRRVQSQVVRAEIKNRTPLRRKTHFEVKMHKTRQRRSTFGNSNVEKLHAAVASSTFPSENAKKLTVSDTFWSSDVEKLHAAVQEAHFQVKMHKTRQRRTTFWSSDVENKSVSQLASWSVSQFVSEANSQLVSSSGS